MVNYSHLYEIINKNKISNNITVPPTFGGAYSKIQLEPTFGGAYQNIKIDPTFGGAYNKNQLDVNTFGGAY